MDYDCKKIDEWAEGILREGRKPCRYTEEYVDPFEPDMYIFQSVCANKFVKIERAGREFYAYFQPCYNKSAPLAVHTPGYGSEMSMHPELARYFNVLEISPLGYNTPKGKNRAKLTMNGVGTVYPDTLVSGGKEGYAEWLADCVAAVEWARAQSEVISDRVGFFGTSQGGGAAMLLSSIYSAEGIVRAAAAEQPFLTDFETMRSKGAYAMGLDRIEAAPAAMRAQGEYLVDTMHHVHRIHCPVLLTAGGKDEACFASSVKRLFEALSGTKSYSYFEYLPHGYSREFVCMVQAWFTMYL